MDISKIIQTLRKKLDIQTRDTSGEYESCGYVPYTKIEQFKMTQELKRQGLKHPPQGKGKEYCEYLDKCGKCTVYQERPIICRVAGVVTEMKDMPSCTDKQIETPEEMKDYVKFCSTGNDMFLHLMKKKL